MEKLIKKFKDILDAGYSENKKESVVFKEFAAEAQRLSIMFGRWLLKNCDHTFSTDGLLCWRYENSITGNKILYADTDELFTIFLKEYE